MHFVAMKKPVWGSRIMIIILGEIMYDTANYFPPCLSSLAHCNRLEIFEDQLGDIRHLIVSQCDLREKREWGKSIGLGNTA